MVRPSGSNSILFVQIDDFVLFMSTSLHFIYFLILLPLLSSSFPYSSLSTFQHLHSPLTHFPLTYLFRKSWVTASCTRQARPLLLDTKWRVSVLFLSNIIAKASGWFAFICRQANNIQVQVNTHTHTPSTYFFFSSSWFSLTAASLGRFGWFILPSALTETRLLV